MHRLAIPRFLLLGTALALIAPAYAQSTAQDGSGFSLQLGSGSHARRATLGRETPVLWTQRSTGSQGRVELTGEFSLSYWDATQGRQPASVWQLSATPMLRWWPGGQRLYLEGGIGPTLFSRTRFSGEAISTAFQLGNHLGLGYQFTPAIRAGLRFSHFSNAGIKKPNPGLNLLQLTYTHRY